MNALTVRNSLRGLTGSIVTALLAPVAAFCGLLSSGRKPGAERRLQDVAGRTIPEDPLHVVIVGGEFYNRGGQAMTFTVVDQLLRRFPNAEIHLFTNRREDIAEARGGQYAFSVTDWSWRIRLAVFLPWLTWVAKGRRAAVFEARSFLSKARFVVDVSGYALSSQWSTTASTYYLLHILTARKYGLPYFIFPQSIGPFDYGPLERLLLPRKLLRKCLEYPDEIFIRERSGQDTLRKLGISQARMHPDICLYAEPYDVDRIYRQPPASRSFRIPPDAVAVVPNIRVNEIAAPGAVMAAYRSLIKRLLDDEREVRIVTHSVEDWNLCKRIKELFPDETRLVWIDASLDAVELENLLKQFDFVVASRYHAAIHAYRNGVPALVLGWAAKYGELLTMLGQDAYMVDVRQDDIEEKLLDGLERMLANRESERQKLHSNLAAGTNDTLFSLLPYIRLPETPHDV